MNLFSSNIVEFHELVCENIEIQKKFTLRYFLRKRERGIHLDQNAWQFKNLLTGIERGKMKGQGQTPAHFTFCLTCWPFLTIITREMWMKLLRYKDCYIVYFCGLFGFILFFFSLLFYYFRVGDEAVEASSTDCWCSGTQSECLQTLHRWGTVSTLIDLQSASQIGCCVWLYWL